MLARTVMQATVLVLGLASLLVVALALPSNNRQTPRLEAALLPRDAGGPVAAASVRQVPPNAALVSGSVVDARTNQPVPGALIRTAPLAGSAVSDSLGNFVLDEIPLTAPYATLTVTVNAPGYAAWTARDLAIYPGVALILDVRLGESAQSISVGLPSALARTRTQVPDAAMPPRVAVTPRYFSNEIAPATIKVAITPYANCGDWLNNGKPVLKVIEVPFKDYVKNVLPNEWGPSWDTQGAGESLRAGAIAVKMFAWWRMNIGGRPQQGADVVDNTCDQRYVEGVHYDSTDRAVEDTWNYRMRDSGKVVEIHYLSTAAYCSGYVRCMPQWGTYDDARKGMRWPDIVHKYYDPVQLDGVAARAAWTTNAAGVKEGAFAPGEGMQYVAEVWNIGSLPQDASFTWSAGDACGSTTLWSGTLSTPPGYWWWTLAGNVPDGACIGSATFTSTVTFSGLSGPRTAPYAIANPTVCTNTSARLTCITRTPTPEGTPTATPTVTQTPLGWVPTSTFTPTPLGPPTRKQAPDFFWSFLPFLRKSGTATPTLTPPSGPRDR